MNKSDKIFVAGHRGMVGSAMVRWLESKGFNNLLTRDHAQLDLANESAVAKFFAEERPTIVIVAAARVGGIKANDDFPVEFLLENLQIQNNAAKRAIGAD
jgi:GDP-L-fucose synthase